MSTQIQQHVESVTSYALGIGAITLSQFIDFTSTALQLLTLIGGCAVIWHRFYFDRLKRKRFEQDKTLTGDEEDEG